MLARQGRRRRTLTAPARFSCSTPGTRSRVLAKVCWRRSRATRRAEQPTRSEASIFVRRRGDPVAARWVGHPSNRVGERGARRLARVQRRRLLHPRPRRPRRAELGATGARDDVRSHSRVDTRALRPEPHSRRWPTDRQRCCAVLTKRGRVKFESLRVDGGASANNWLLQFQSDRARHPRRASRHDRDDGAWCPRASPGIAGGSVERCGGVHRHATVHALYADHAQGKRERADGRMAASSAGGAGVGAGYLAIPA